MTEVLVQAAAEQTPDGEAVFGNQALRSQLRQLDARLASLDNLSQEPARPSVPRNTSESLSRAVTFLPGTLSLEREASRSVTDRILSKPLLAQPRNLFPAQDDQEAEHSHSSGIIVLGGCVEAICVCTVLGFWIHEGMIAVQSSDSDCGDAVTAFWILLSSTLILMTCCGLWGLAGSTRGVIVGCSMAATFAVIAAVFTGYVPLVPASCSTPLTSAFQRLAIVHWSLAAVFLIGASALHYIHLAHHATPQSDDHALLQMARKAGKGHGAFPLASLFTKIPRIAKVTELLKRDHALFLANVRLAFVAAFWMSLFAAPICWPAIYTFLFGSETMVTLDGAQVPLCETWRRGRYVNTAQPGSRPDLRAWKQGEEWNPDDPSMVDCGMVFKSYLSHWPFVVQMLAYTIWHNTGSTVRLALQGFAGTFAAVLNFYVMTVILPHGAKGHHCTAAEAAQKLCAIGTILHDDPHYAVWGIWLCWVDVVFVLFLFLISTAPQNILKFGMSYHVYFMMTFMDYRVGVSAGHYPTRIPGVEWDSTVSATLITAAFGCILSVVITYLPIPLLNMGNLDRDTLIVVHSIKDIWRMSINYFCGPAQTEMDQRIKSRIRTLDEPLAVYATHLNDAWWETFDIGHFGIKRDLYGHWSVYAHRFQSVMSALQTTIETAHFGEHHRSFCNTSMQEAMVKLNVATAESMELLAVFCKEGQISEIQKSNINDSLARTRKLQAEMLRKYNDIMFSMKSEQCVARHFSHENMFCFILSAWSRRCTRFAEKAIKDDAPVSPIRTFLCSFTNVFETDRVVDQGPGGGGNLCSDVEHLKFCLRNLTSIVLCFALGYYLPASFKGTVFTPCSPVMANALALLISKKPGSAMKKSLERLLSVTLGMVLPILAISLVGICPQEYHLRPVVHMLFIFAYMFLFEYMHLTSTTWSALGCNTAAFGATFLFARSASLKTLDWELRYKEIAQVIFAVLIQMLVDMFFTGNLGRHHAVKAVDLFTTKFRKCLVGLWEEHFDLEELHRQMGDLQEILLFVEQCIPEVDQSMQLIASWRPPFRHQLYRSAVHSFRELTGDLRVLLLALADRPGDGGGASITQRLRTFNKVYRELIRTFDDVTWLLRLILDQMDDRPITDPRALQMEAWATEKELDGLNELYGEINEMLSTGKDEGRAKASLDEVLCDDVRVRCAVLARSLQNGRIHLMGLLTNCLQENIYED